MTDLRKAAGMALVALNSFDPHDDELWYSEKSADEIDSAITALRQALTQPEQEQYVTKVVAVHEDGTYTTERIPLPKREWVGLTDEEIDKTMVEYPIDYKHEFAKAIEAKLKEKNT